MRRATLLLLFLLATAVRLYHLQSQSIWFDEGWSAYAAGQPSLQAAINADQTNPPLYYVLVNLIARGAGDSEFALRYVSLLFGLMVVALSYRLAGELFNAKAGLVAAFLTAFSPLLWWASQEARMYTLLAALVLISALAWFSLKRRASWSTWIALWLSELALLYAHNTGPVVVIWLNVVTVVAWGGAFRNVQSGQSSDTTLTLNPSTSWRGTLKTLMNPLALREKGQGVRVSFYNPIIWFAGQVVVALLWFPYFRERFTLLQEANSGLSNVSPLSLQMLGQLWQALWTGAWSMVGQEPLLVILSALLFVLMILMIPWRNPNARWLVLHVVILTAGLWLGLTVLGNEIHGRYLVMIAPLLLVGVSGWWSVVSGQLPVASHQSSVIRDHSDSVLGTRYSVLGTAYCVLTLLTFITAVHFTTTNPAYQHDDARGMVQYYADHLTENDTVLMWSYADRYELAYYWDRLGVKARRITLPEGRDLSDILPLLPTSGDVALNIWYTQRADYRGMMDCLLSDGTVNEPERHAVYGMTNLLFRTPALTPLKLHAVDYSLNGAELRAVGELPNARHSDQALCLPLQLTLTQPLSVDLKAVVRLHNRLGWEIARTDAIFADAIQRTTSQLPVDSTVTAYARLRLPYGAPADEYTVSITIYDEQIQPSGYDLNDSGVARKNVTIGTWRTLPGADWSAVNRQTPLTVSVNLPVAPDLTLLAHDLQPYTLRNGDMLRFSLLWQGSGDLPELRLADQENRWQVVIQPPAYPNRDDITLDWREVQIPPDASDDMVDVRLADGQVLATYPLESLPALAEPPEFDTPADVSVPEIGRLVGYSVSGDMTDRTRPFSLTLVWQAQQSTSVSYTVFAQLIRDNGRVLAQSDSIPAGGARPTTGWRANEYIVDTHTVTFHDDATPGTARLIVGLYDATTGQRAQIAPGVDFITLLQGIEVK